MEFNKQTSDTVLSNQNAITATYFSLYQAIFRLHTIIHQEECTSLCVIYCQN